MQEARFAKWENNLKTFEKLFSMIQSRCSIYGHYTEISTLKHSCVLAPTAYSNEDYNRRF